MRRVLIERRGVPVKPRAGFTLVEMLVVIAIIGVLAGLLLPAVQMAREASRRSQCGNNLHQLALALHNFSDANGHLPSNLRPPGVTPQPRIAWETFLLPYFEQQALYDKIDQSQNWSAATAVAPYTVANSTLVGTRISTFECPSSPSPERLDGDPQVTASPPIAAPTDYGAITHVETALVTAGLVDVAGNGMMPKNAKPHLSETTDGLSNTILLAESAGKPNVWQKRVRIDPFPTVKTNGGGWCRPASDFSLYGSSWDGASFPGPSAINSTNGQDIGSATFPYPAPYGSNGTGATYAFHPAGANVVFGDGSVKFMQEKVDIRLYARLVTRDKGELVSPGDLER